VRGPTNDEPPGPAREALVPSGVDVTIECRDGYPLSARVFHPSPDRDRRRTAIVAPATGAKASYYWRYAAFLATTGLRAIVADYRGIGRSAPEGTPAALRHLASAGTTGAPSTSMP
jgi:predicted alpha/beta hydrolase